MSNPTLDKLEAWQSAMIAYIPPPTTVGLPAHRMGVHLIGGREADYAYMATLRPAAVKIVDPDPTVVRRVLNLIDPNGVVILRDHPMSEQKADMAADPTGTGRRHAADWIAKPTTGRFAEFGGDKRIVVVGINEPDVHNEAEERIVLAYTLAFLQTLTAAGIRGLALNLSVGWPRNLGTNLPPTWETFKPLESEILKGNHFLCTHEYWYPIPQDKWGWYANRISHCPMSVPIIIGECGYTRQLANLPQPWGYWGNISPQTYAAQLWDYHDRVESNVFAVLPFTTGFASFDWASKDTQPAHADILGRKHAYTWPSVWPVPKVAVPPVEPPISEKDLIIFPKFTNRITGFYGQIYNSYSHEGMDISAVIGTPVYAAYDGIVAYSDNEPTTYGEYIRTYHPELDTCFFYGHLSERLVSTQNSVKQGQLIGYTGNTGNSTGPHLHFEVRAMTPSGSYKVWKTGQPLYRQNGRVDPLGWLTGWLGAGKRVEER